MDAVERVRRAFARIAEVERPEVWIELRAQDEVEAEAAAIDPGLPLAGAVLAVKGNFDVAGLRTTAGCPSYGRVAGADAPAVARLKGAGAVVLGTTNMDQFATGLVGTRSPHGAVRNAVDPAYVSGGSSSGSAVAVALGIADLAVGTDTAGSGRIPAAFNGIVGLKPTHGLVPADGVVPACRSLDCVSVFARTLDEAHRALGILAARPIAPRPRRPGPWRVAVPAATRDLGAMPPGWGDAYASAARSLRTDLLPIDVSPFLEAGDLLYGGAFIAERYTAVGAFITERLAALGARIAEQSTADGAPDLDPTVASIVAAASDIPAYRLFSDRERLAELRAAAMHALGEADVLLLPTAPFHPTIAEVKADPVGVNARLGRFTNSTNLLGMASIAVPHGQVDGRPFGVMLLGHPGSDDHLAAIASALPPTAA
ncbi:allophanate hydrolase [Actinomadura rupiterrae]|uniref:allophanate hydrolase n=1 Tax=Actinomadura rupiterrae TaxID=559627 RepID=UPI0020A53F95|nr:allophanate hydrolase [Actinomadura rupiterrae]MCP2343701.1 allophanate hydrolase [Actinomadura rupiterrae]